MKNKLINCLTGFIALFIPGLAAATTVPDIADSEIMNKINEPIASRFTGVNITTESPFTEYEFISQIGDPVNLLVAITGFILSFVAIIAIIFIIVGGYYYITAHGEESQLEKGKKIIISAVIGLLVTLAAYTIVATILNLGALPIPDL